MSYYAQHNNAGASAELEHQREQSELFKSLENSQALIRIKLQILCRNGKTKALMDDIEDAAAEYGAAFTAIINAAPIAQKAIPHGSAKTQKPHNFDEPLWERKKPKGDSR